MDRQKTSFESGIEPKMESAKNFGNKPIRKRIPTQPAQICMKNPGLYGPKQRQPSREPLERIFEIKDLDVNTGIIQAEAVVRKEQTSTGKRVIPRSAKQVQLVKRAVSKSPEMQETKAQVSQSHQSQKMFSIAPEQLQRAQNVVSQVNQYVEIQAPSTQERSKSNAQNLNFKQSFTN